MNYFMLFNMPRQFKIDQKLLSEKFYTLQLTFHPDLFMNDCSLKKKMILKKSIEINKGYKILKNFSSRAIYLLNLNGYKINANTVLLNQNHFLKKYFSLYEDIDNLKKNSFNEKKWNVFLKKVEQEIINCKKNIELEFEKENYKSITTKIEQLLFLKKIKSNFQNQKDIYSRSEN